MIASSSQNWIRQRILPRSLRFVCHGFVCALSLVFLGVSWSKRNVCVWEPVGVAPWKQDLLYWRMSMGFSRGIFCVSSSHIVDAREFTLKRSLLTLSNTSLSLWSSDTEKLWKKNYWMYLLLHNFTDIAVYGCWDIGISLRFCKISGFFSLFYKDTKMNTTELYLSFELEKWVTCRKKR